MDSRFVFLAHLTTLEYTIVSIKGETWFNAFFNDSSAMPFELQIQCKFSNIGRFLDCQVACDDDVPHNVQINVMNRVVNFLSTKL